MKKIIAIENRVITGKGPVKKHKNARTISTPFTTVPDLVPLCAMMIKTPSIAKCHWELVTDKLTSDERGNRTISKAKR
jgi:hypothetical protein